MRRSINLNKATPPGGVPVYEILPEADVQKIIDATFSLMREIGVAFDPDPRALDLFAGAGRIGSSKALFASGKRHYVK